MRAIQGGMLVALSVCSKAKFRRNNGRESADQRGPATWQKHSCWDHHGCDRDALRFLLTPVGPDNQRPLSEPIFKTIRSTDFRRKPRIPSGGSAILSVRFRVSVSRMILHRHLKCNIKLRRASNLV